MFEKGEYVVYGSSGICQIVDITRLDMPGIDRKRLYYDLAPVNAAGSKIYSPVDNTRVTVRPVMTEEEAWGLIDEIPEIQELWVGNEKMREEQYKEALQTCDCREWVKIIKALYLRKQERISQGKKITVVDERYLRMAEDCLYSELAFVLGREKEGMEDLITDRINRLKLEG